MDAVFLNHIRDLSERSYNSGRFVFTSFLDLEQQSILNSSSRELTSYSLFGGTDGCERVVARFGDENDFGYSEPFPVVCIKAEPLNKKFSDELTHRDFLGALMNLGMERECLGDIVIRDNTAYIFALKNKGSYICDNLIKVRHTSISCEITEELPDGELFRTEEISVIVSSMRLDCIISAVYNMSRSVCNELFESQRVFVNGKMILNNSHQPKTGDIVSVRHYGRFITGEITGNTRKGRCVLTLKKYV